MMIAAALVGMAAPTPLQTVPRPSTEEVSPPAATDRPTATTPTESSVTAPDGEEEAVVSGLTLGGAIRGRYDLRFNDVDAGGRRDVSSHLSFDTLILTADYDSSTLFGAAQYRFYGGSFLYSRRFGYDGYPGEVSFPVYGYVGVKLDPETRITAGLQPVPFEDRYWGSGFLNSLGYIYGLEEVYNVGVTLSRGNDRYTVEGGFFPTDAPNAFGMSEDSARYSVNIVRGDASVPFGSRNAERNMVVGRLQYRLIPGETNELIASASAWFSTVHNFTTGRDGSRRAFAISLAGREGAWRAKALLARQDMDLRNPESNDLVTVGNFDAPFNIAARGTLAFAEIGREIDTGSLPFTLDLFANYARFVKDTPGRAPDTQRLNVGAFWSDKASERVRVWSELVVGRNDPFVGANQYSLGAATGGDDRYKVSALVVFGYYF